VEGRLDLPLAGDGGDWPSVQRSVEEAVLDLLGPYSGRSPAIERNPRRRKSA